MTALRPARCRAGALRDNRQMRFARATVGAATALIGAVVAVIAGGDAAAQSAKPVYRCPGPPVLYTDQLTAGEARDRGCRTIEGAPVTVVQLPRARPPASAPSGAARPADTRVDAAAQRARDSDARRILADELQREEQNLALLRLSFNNGEPERRGDERNYQKYIDRVAEMRAQLTRKEADVAALRRELAKLPP